MSSLTWAWPQMNILSFTFPTTHKHKENKVYVNIVCLRLQKIWYPTALMGSQVFFHRVRRAKLYGFILRTARKLIKTMRFLWKRVLPKILLFMIFAFLQKSDIQQLWWAAKSSFIVPAVRNYMGSYFERRESSSKCNLSCKTMFFIKFRVLGGCVIALSLFHYCFLLRV